MSQWIWFCFCLPSAVNSWSLPIQVDGVSDTAPTGLVALRGDDDDKTCHSERMIRPGPFHHLINGWSQPQHCPVSTTSIIIYWTCPISMTVVGTWRLVRVTIALPGLLGTSRIPPRSDGDGCSERLFLQKVKVDYIGNVNSQ